ncbi:galactose-proton symport [Lichtheimia corymbifera JMRC:FSU:9682]|uniref:Galactose-proton symport n=1 Tax=Lichtheimia corymbifera JMRC:FSU:9682 TaxID=1263082 RepID=A0A068RQ11_9FUNG|nr:galactose-proton symport [Lichtheimia corymbifera JMRC:FSU:9682]
MTVAATTQPEATKQSHPGYFRIVRQGTPEQYSSKLVAERDFPKGSVIAQLEGLTPGPKAYSSVQISKTEHIELNSDLLYMNHSCDPSVCMDIDKRAITALKDIRTGDELTFFYPSTEWDMAQPFDCWCGSSQCIKRVMGARHLSTETLQKFCLAKHIEELVAERQ